MKSEAQTEVSSEAEHFHYSQIENWFAYHEPKGDQVERFELIRKTAKVMASVIVRTVPDCADRTSALRKLRETVMTANSAIACNEFNEHEWKQS